MLDFTHEGRDFEIQGFFAADTDFFKIFSFDFIFGDPETALLAPESIVITKDTAVKIFGRADVLGNTFTIPFGPGTQELRVAGIVENIPRNSHFQFDVILSINALRQLANNQPGGRGNFLSRSYLFQSFLLCHAGGKCGCSGR